MSDRAKPFITLLYLGVREGRHAPRVHLWAEIEDIPNDGRPLPTDVKTRIYGAANERNNNVAAGAAPGSIFRFEQDYSTRDERKAIYPHSAVYQGRWKNKENVARWQEESRTIDQAIERRANG